MAGLGAAAEAPAPTSGMDEQAGEPVSPEEQAMYEQFVNAALGIIYPQGADQVSPEILANLKGDIDPQAMLMFAEVQPPLTNSPQDSVAATATLLTMLIDGQGGGTPRMMQQPEAAPAPAMQDGQPPQPGAPPAPEPAQPEQQGGYPDDVVLHGGVAIIEELIEVAEAAKIHDFSEQDIEGITYRAMDLFRTASPRVDQDALKAEFGQVVEADRAGTLGKILPGLPGGASMKAA